MQPLGVQGRQCRDVEERSERIAAPHALRLLFTLPQPVNTDIPVFIVFALCPNNATLAPFSKISKYYFMKMTEEDAEKSTFNWVISGRCPAAAVRFEIANIAPGATNKRTATIQQ